MTETDKKRSYAPLWILIAMCALPYIAGSLYYQYRGQLPSTGLSNYGQLIQPVRPTGDFRLTLLDGSEKEFSEFGQKWTMLYILDAECDTKCAQNLYFMRQIRKAMAEDRYRITRLVILDDPKLESESLHKTLSAFPGMYVATIRADEKKRLYENISGGSKNMSGRILLVDPMNNFMMEFPAEPDPMKLLKDMKRLLDVSRIG